MMLKPTTYRDIVASSLKWYPTQKISLKILHSHFNQNRGRPTRSNWRGRGPNPGSGKIPQNATEHRSNFTMTGGRPLPDKVRERGTTLPKNRKTGTTPII